nr:immunoglobulin heavy chain junction region [Mus musculus]
CARANYGNWGYW